MGETIKRKIYTLLFIKFILIFIVALGLNILNVNQVHNIYVDILESLGIATIITFISYLFLKKDLSYYNSLKQ
jgi:hypothetical protein